VSSSTLGLKPLDKPKLPTINGINPPTIEKDPWIKSTISPRKLPKLERPEKKHTHESKGKQCTT
jgi:hypothetical protein